MGINLLFTIILVLFGGIGLVLGFCRGWKRATLRFALVLLAAILSASLAGPVAEKMLHTPVADINADFSAVTGEAEIPADATLEDVIMIAVENNKDIAQLTAAAPTMTKFLMSLPRALVSVILFVLFFFVLKIVLWIVQIFVNVIFLRKKTGRTIGAAIGLAQGVVCALVLLVPVLGMMNIMDTTVAAVDEMEADGESTENETVATIRDIDENYYGPAKGDVSYVILEKTGIKNVCVQVFYQVSTTKDETGATVCFFRDLNDNMPAFVQLVRLQGMDFNNLSQADIKVLRDVVTRFAASPLIGNTVAEVTHSFSSTLLRGEAFMGVKLPSADENESSYKFMRDTLDTLVNATGEDLVNDLGSVVDLFGVMVQYNLLKNNDGNNMTDILLKNEDCLGDMLTIMVNSRVLAPVVVSAANYLGMENIAASLGVPANDAEAYDDMIVALIASLAERGTVDYTDEAATPKAEDVQKIADILASYTSGLSTADAEQAAKNLLRRFCAATSTAEERTYDAVSTCLESTDIAALKKADFVTLKIKVPALLADDKYMFSDMNESSKNIEVDHLKDVISQAGKLMDEAGDGDLDLANNKDIFPTMGKMLNSMKGSALLGKSARGLMLYFLDTESVKDVVSEAALNALRAKVQDDSLDYEAAFTSIGAAYRLADSLNSSKETTPEQLGDALKDLVSSMDKDTADIIRETVDDKFLSDAGIPEDVSDTAKNVLDTLIDVIAESNEDDTIDYEQESKAVSDVVSMLTNSSESETKDDVLTDEMLDTITNSTIISNTLIKTAEKEGASEDLKNQFTEEQRQTIADTLDAYEANCAGDADKEECLNALRSLFGI